LILVMTAITVSMLSPIESEEVYKVKAGFLYRFLQFAQWPDEAFRDSENEIVIGILGRNPFGEFFQSVANEPVDGRELVIRMFPHYTPDGQLKRCHLLYICSSEKENLEEILELLRGSPVLTVSEVKGFVSSGGMINFIMKKNNVSFEINKVAADNAGIKLRSKFLRVAARVIKD
ncbi:MAG: YfiR family protein, partial [bacterium]|nr:YfiR family protein [bacterium]